MKYRILQFPANVALLFGLQGILFACIGGGMILHTRDFIARAERVPGRVVALEYGGQNALFPVIAYSTGGEEEVRFRGGIGSNPSAYSVGEEVSVYYDPQGSHHPLIAGPLELWALSGVFLGFGILMTPLLYVAWRIR
jgi:hypothetical protein